MRKIGSILLIALLLACQHLVVPHSHAGPGLAAPDGHSARPHVHFGGHDDDHHHHSHSEGDHHSDVEHHDDGDVGIAHSEDDLPGHDSHAIFLPESRFLNDARATELPDAGSAVSSALDIESTALAAFPLHGRPEPTLARGHLKCPIFLRTLSIRC